MKLGKLLENLDGETEIIIKHEIRDMDKTQVWYEGKADDIPHTLIDYGADYSDSIAITDDGKLEVTLGQPKIRKNKLTNNQWIPITEGIPPTGDVLIVTIFDTIRQRRELRYPVSYRKSYYSDSYGFYQYGVEENVLLPEFSEILAWMPIPKPYDEVFGREE